jgi:Xaa-Pro dipeptidase
VSLFLNNSVLIIKNYYCYNNSEDTVSHDWTLKMIQERMDWPMLYTGNPYVIQPGNVFFMHMILMDSVNELAMNLGETYLITEKGNERLGKQKLDLVVL